MKRITLNLVLLLLVAIQWQCTESSGEDSPENSSSLEKEHIQKFSTIPVKPGTVQSQVNLTGRVVPLQKIDVVAQVQGIAENRRKPFEEGITFQRGEVLVSLEDDEFRSNLAAQKSQFLASLVRIMSDIKIDYPSEFEVWNRYLKNLDIGESLATLPDVNNEQLRYFLAANNIFNLYHTIKSQEETLKKYTIRAPFTGAVTQANLDAGGLVNPGVKLGELIRTDEYEVQAAVSLEDVDLVEPGQTVELSARSTSGSWKGTVNRIGKRVDPSTQSVAVYLRVKGDDLKEGMYLEGNIASRSYENAVEIPKEVLTRQNQVYIIEDSTVKLKDVDPLEFHENTAIVRGLAANDQLITDAGNSPIQGIKAVSR